MYILSQINNDTLIESCVCILSVIYTLDSYICDYYYLYINMNNLYTKYDLHASLLIELSMDIRCVYMLL